MKGNEIMVSSEPRGRFVEGIIGSGLTPKPGTIMQIDYTVALKGGRWTWKLYDRAADGDRPKGPIIVLTEAHLKGGTSSDAYAEGDRAFGYIPLAGDELNVRLKDIAGTGDDHTIGEVLIIDDGTGLLIATTGSPQSEPFTLQETVTDPTADTLAWCVYTGY